MVKSSKGMARDCKKAFNILNMLSKEVGAYALGGSWTYNKKLIVQCKYETLKNWLFKNELDFNSSYMGNPSYETENLILMGY